MPTFGILSNLGSAVLGGAEQAMYIANGLGSSVMTGAVVAASGIKKTLDDSGLDKIDKAVSSILDFNPLGSGTNGTEQNPTTTAAGAPDTQNPQSAPVTNATPNGTTTAAPEGDSG